MDAANGAAAERKGRKMITIEQLTKATQEFETDLKNSADMGDRKQAVQFLAAKIGADNARKIARANGLTSEYFFA